jgi:cold shock protein
MKGNVKFYNSTKGFGFIKADDEKEYFFHKSGLGEDVLVQQNDRVEFDVVQGDRGPKAEKIKIAKD